MQAQEEPGEIHKESGFRVNTRNLVMSGLEGELIKMEEELKSSPFQVTRLPEIRDYHKFLMCCTLKQVALRCIC